MRKADFIIVGAPKCGTTALWKYLSSHPQIFMQREKEPHFFGSDLKSKRFQRNPDIYFGGFDEAAENQKTGEASVWYLYSKNAASEIWQCNPETKIIIMLREPIAMLQSLHSQLIYSGHEVITDFCQAVLHNIRYRAKLRRRLFDNINGIPYLDIARYSEQVARYLDTFGRGHVMVLLYEEFFSYISSEYSKVLRFLCVDTNHQPEFKVLNPRRRVKHPHLQVIANSSVGRFIRSEMKRFRLGEALHEAIKRSNITMNRPSKGNPECAHELSRIFRDDVEKLERMLRRDLNLWKSAHKDIF